MQEVYNLVVLFLYLVTLAGLDFTTALSFKALIDLGFEAGFKATLGAAIRLIFNTAVEDLVFRVTLEAATGVTLEVVLKAISIAILGAE